MATRSFFRLIAGSHSCLHYRWRTLTFTILAVTLFFLLAHSRPLSRTRDFFRRAIVDRRHENVTLHHYFRKACKNDLTPRTRYSYFDTYFWKLTCNYVTYEILKWESSEIGRFLRKHSLNIVANDPFLVIGEFYAFDLMET